MVHVVTGVITSPSSRHIGQVDFQLAITGQVTFPASAVLETRFADLAQVEEQLGRLTAAEAFYRAIGLLTRGFLG